ncbi:alpha-2 adrenergic receptor [Trichonephila clavipes]|nr:alpha-2 adrenergic receptor [Trichonephila clavipes]
MKIGNNGNLILGPFDESTPCLMIVLMNCQIKLRINHLTAVKSVAILERNANLNFYTWKKTLFTFPQSLFVISLKENPPSLSPVTRPRSDSYNFCSVDYTRDVFEIKFRPFSYKEDDTPGETNNALKKPHSLRYKKTEEASVLMTHAQRSEEEKVAANRNARVYSSVNLDDKQMCAYNMINQLKGILLSDGNGHVD